MLPDKFQERMKPLLGEEWERFAAAMCEDAVRGVRINRIKTDPDTYKNGIDNRIVPFSYYEDGFYFTSDESVGVLPEHHAGIFYMQDPGAMASVAAVDIPSAHKRSTLPIS